VRLWMVRGRHNISLKVPPPPPPMPPSPEVAAMRAAVEMRRRADLLVKNGDVCLPMLNNICDRDILWALLGCVVIYVASTSCKPYPDSRVVPETKAPGSTWTDQRCIDSMPQVSQRSSHTSGGCLLVARWRRTHCALTDCRARRGHKLEAGAVPDRPTDAPPTYSQRS
jgi:hypothetical protein